jgi:hypothetical protein
LISELTHMSMYCYGARRDHTMSYYDLQERGSFMRVANSVKLLNIAME